jgi:DNA-binding protein HU-beta
MTKQGFIDHIASQHGCTKREGEKIIDMFTSSVIEAMGEGKEITLAGFGIFSINKLAARKGRNHRSGEGLDIPAHNQPRFKAGSKLKAACNK